mgnify:CR=1 FL=1
MTDRGHVRPEPTASSLKPNHTITVFLDLWKLLRKIRRRCPIHNNTAANARNLIVIRTGHWIIVVDA